MAVRVLIADDQSIVRQSLQSFLLLDPDLEIIATATNAKEAVDLTRQLKPQLVLIDLVVPEINGFEATRIIRTKMPEVLVLVLTNDFEIRTVTQALQAGANGFLLKCMEASALCHAIKTASPHQIILSPAVAHNLVCNRIMLHQTLAKSQKAEPNQNTLKN